MTNIIDIFRIFCLGVPASFVFILPVSFLIGWVTVVSRLSGDFEILAVQTSGVNPRTILKPVVFSGLILAGFMLYTNNVLSPFSASRMDRMIKKTISKNLVRLKSSTFEKFGDFIFYAEKVEENRLKNVRIYKLEKNFPRMAVFAASGEIRESAEPAVGFFLKNGSMIFNDPGDKSSVVTVKFGGYSFSVDTGFKAAGHRKIVQMTSRQLRERIKEYRRKKLPARFLEVEFYLRGSLAFGGLFLALVGVVLATRVKSSKRVAGVGVSLFIVFFYWFLFTALIHLAENGWVRPWLACWLPNGIFLALAAASL